MSSKGDPPIPPALDPIVDQIDALLTLLEAWRATLVQVGDPRPAAAEARHRVQELRDIVVDGDRATALARWAEVQTATALHDGLSAAEANWTAIARAVNRLHSALPEPALTDAEKRDKFSRYVVSLLDTLWTAKLVDGVDRGLLGIRPETVADRLIGLVVAVWPEHGARLLRRRAALIERLARLQARGRGAPPKELQGGKTAKELREEILGMVFEVADLDTLKKRRQREKRRARK